MAKTLGASKLKKKKLDTKPLVGGVQLEYKTIRAQRWVFVNGKEVGTIDPMLSAAGKWAFIPLRGHEGTRPDAFKEIIFGRTIGDIKRTLNWKLTRKERMTLLGLTDG